MNTKNFNNHKVTAIIESAQGFERISIKSIELLIESGKDWGVFLPVAVMNTCFCLELLFKAIHTKNSNKIKGHDLLKLYSNLPKEDRLNIEKLYLKNRFNKPKYIGNSHSYISTTQNTPVTFKPMLLPANLEDVLKAHEKSFNTFRYIYEVPELYQQYYFEHEILETLIKSLFEYVKH